MFTKASGLMIRQKGKVFIFIRTGHLTQASGITTSNMDMDTRNGQMEHNMKVIIFKE